MNFSEAIKELESGKCIARIGWNGDKMFVYKQIPTSIYVSDIEKIKSMPDTAKSILQNPMYGLNCICFNNQMNLCNLYNGCINSWIPSSSDIYSDDWFIFETSIV